MLLALAPSLQYFISGWVGPRDKPVLSANVAKRRTPKILDGNQDPKALDGLEWRE